MTLIPDEIGALAIGHGLGSALYEAARGFDVEIPPDLRRCAEDARFVRLSSMNVLPEIGAALDRAGIPWVVLKGPAVGAFYERPELRGFSDLDLMVRGADLERAIESLGDAGVADFNRNWVGYLRYGIAECPLLAPGVAVDLHWHIVATDRRRKRTTVDIAAMLKRRRSIRLGEIDVAALDPEDQLMNVCIHAGLSGADRLGWLRDVRELVRADSINWDVFGERCVESGVAARVGQVLDRARCLLGAGVPSAIPPALCPRALLIARRRLDERTVSGYLSSGTLRKLPVRGSGNSVGDVSAVLRSSILARFGAGPNWDFSDDESVLFFDDESGGPGARAAYFRYAAAGQRS
ncbi:MAG: nucleotidyltransferase family protein [Acidimicrobiales bacterium]